MKFGSRMRVRKPECVKQMNERMNEHTNEQTRDAGKKQ